MGRLMPSRQLRKDLSEYVPSIRNLSLVKSDKLVKTGTTALALEYNGGVVVAADRRTSAGDMIFDHASRKIQPVSNCSVMTCAGTVAFVQIVLDAFKKHVRDFEMENQFSLPLKAQASALQKIIRFLAFNVTGDLMSEFILAGYDHIDNCPRVFEFDSLGGKYGDSPYRVVGSGTPEAISSLDRHFSLPENGGARALSKEEAVSMAIEALRRSSYRDKHTGPLPLVFMIDKENVAEREFVPVSHYEPRNLTRRAPKPSKGTEGEKP